MRCKVRKNIRHFEKMYQEKGIDINEGMYVINAYASRDYTHIMEKCCMCITRSRGYQGGHYVTKLRRFMTVQEIGALQGLSKDMVATMKGSLRGRSKSKVLGAAIGDAMSLNVLMRVLPRALHSAGLIPKYYDPWAMAMKHMDLPTGWDMPNTLYACYCNLY